MSDRSGSYLNVPMHSQRKLCRTLRDRIALLGRPRHDAVPRFAMDPGGRLTRVSLSDPEVTSGLVYRRPRRSSPRNRWLVPASVLTVRVRLQDDRRSLSERI
jgi:hypothetical protein